MTILRYVESEDRYSVYLDRDDNEVYLAHGHFLASEFTTYSRRRLVELDTLDLAALWQSWPGSDWFAQNRFRDHVATLIIEEEDEVEETVQFCADCNDLEAQDDLSWVNSSHGGSVCDSCIDEYWFCNDCEERFPSTTTTLAETEVCDSCRARNWTFCDTCDGYRHDRDYDHDHEPDPEEGCGCEAPRQSFTIRNDGEFPLANDTRVTVSLPAGIISDEGLGAIATYLRETSYDPVTCTTNGDLYNLSYNLGSLGEKWQTKQGNYTKRLSRLAYQSLGIKLSPEIVSRVGCIARDHSTAVHFDLETTRDLNQSAEDFGHEDSCWWGSYFTSRCLLKSNGGFGLRTFDEYDTVTGRAWVLPLKLDGFDNLTPTFNTDTPDAFMVFNGYHALENWVPARIVAHMAGMTYRKVGFTAAPMYINNDAGYLVAPEAIADKYTDGRLNLSVPVHNHMLHTTETNEGTLTHV